MPKLFNAYPETKDMMLTWCSQHLATLTYESVATYIKTELVPEIYQTDLNECEQHNTTPRTKVEFLKEMNLSVIHPMTAGRWLHYLGYEYKARKRVTSMTDTNMKKM